MQLFTTGGEQKICPSQTEFFEPTTRTGERRPIGSERVALPQRKLYRDAVLEIWVDGDESVGDLIALVRREKRGTWHYMIYHVARPEPADLERLVCITSLIPTQVVVTAGTHCMVTLTSTMSQ